MGLRTADAYRAGLRDGRRVYIRGERVLDVTKHPILGVACDTLAAGYELTSSGVPAIRDLFTAQHPTSGEPIHRMFLTPKDSQTLLLRSSAIQRSIELTGCLPFGKEIGTDCLNAVLVVTSQMDNPKYANNARAFLEHIRSRDLHTCGAVTDVKGDRSKSPSKQKHPDYYLRVVDRNAQGIVVRGAKVHITSAPLSDEIVVLPTRQMRENEADYAVSFAVPSNTKGITFICRSGRGAWEDHEFHPARPLRDFTEAMVVFDDVLVPWERVFLCGEWQYTMPLAYTFATFHRFSAISYKIPCVEIMAGCALAMAKYNGLETAGHIREKLAELAAYVETLRALARAAANDPVMFGDIACPSPLISNMAKLHFASKYHEFCAKIQDIAGGIVATAPDKNDWDNPDTHGYLEHYLGGAQQYSTLDRLKMIHEAMRQVCSHEAAFHQLLSVHAEGSMAAQKMMILAEAPMQRYESLARAFAGIQPWDSLI